MTRAKAFLWVFVLPLFLPLPGFAQLRDYVAIVEPQLHAEAKQGFSEGARIFAARGDSRWEHFFRWHSGEYGARSFGTGWVYIGSDGRPYLITNRHVIDQAGSARVLFEDIDGVQRVYEEVPIAYVDEIMDLAVLSLPMDSYRYGFPVERRRVHDGLVVYAVGFPVLAGSPLWQLSTGIVSNAAVRIDPAYEYLIMHTAPIDPGSSGGPLVVASPESPVGYSVVGVNVAKATQRQSTSFAIPARHLLDAVERAEAAVLLQNSPWGLAADLEREALTLEQVLNSPKPLQSEVDSFLSYAFVAKWGFQSYLHTLSLRTGETEWMRRFAANPVEAMRLSISTQMMAGLKTLDDRERVRYLGIADGDRDRFGQNPEIRTQYTFGSRSVEFVWIREYGRWRIGSAEPIPASVGVPLFALVQS